MKMSIEWHKKSLENMRASHTNYLKEIENCQKHADFVHALILKTEQQIAAAEKAGKDGFDGDKYLQSKKR